MERWHLDNKIALVTGGSKGIGKAIVDEFLQLGATVVTVARNEETLAESIRPWTRENKPVVAVPADVATEEGRRRVLENRGRLPLWRLSWRCLRRPALPVRYLSPTGVPRRT